MQELTQNGIPFIWDLAGSSGASFTLFPLDSHSKIDIDNAKDWLRQNRDVVSVHIATEDDRDRQYKTDYFRVPECRDLKWYQIEQRDEVIRRERLKGTTPVDFVKNMVLPFISETEHRLLQQHGNKIYTF